jgi:hypothetical protein
MDQLRRLVAREDGHIGSGLASLLALAGMVLLPIGLAGDSDPLAIAGAVLLGLGIIVAVNAPHIWVGRIYRRLDRVAPDDPDARTETRGRIEF